MVNNNLHVNFLREKIGELKTALLYCNSKSVLKIPTTIVTAINVDDLGQIWLLVPRPSQNITEFERDFPVTLNFYRKGKNFYLNIDGKAGIVLEPGELDEMAENIETDPRSLLDQWILVKVKVIDTQYHDNRLAVKNSSWITNLSSHFNKLISPAAGSYKPLAIH